MSQRLISRSDDLRRLRDEGYEVAILAGHLVISHVPYVSADKKVGFGTIVSELTLSGDIVDQPGTHVVYFAGELPCDESGGPLTKLVIDGQPPHPVTNDLVATYTFSSKPTPSGVYENYYDKVTTYIAILSARAHVIDPNATARTYHPVVDEAEDAVFTYLDTASSRAGTGVITGKLGVRRVAILGLGGTGSYLLDFLAKTPVREIHLFDGDRYLQHNAFRSPGAPTIEQLQARPFKVDYLATQYLAMRHGITAHAYAIDESNVTELNSMDFVFLSVDDGPAKKVIVDHLEAKDIPFIDVGMGIYEVDGRLAGIVRTTTSTGSAEQRRTAKDRMSFGRGDGEGVYDHNIQIAELNALNASHAVIAWKKLMGFYNDLEHERFSAYAIDTNSLINEDQP